jgi:hypothetical protein
MNHGIENSLLDKLLEFMNVYPKIDEAHAITVRIIPTSSCAVKSVLGHVIANEK